MTSLPLEIVARLRVIEGWMDVAAFAALKSAVDAKIARTQ